MMAIVKDICDPFALYGPGVNPMPVKVTGETARPGPRSLLKSISGQSPRSAAEPETRMEPTAAAQAAVRPGGAAPVPVGQVRHRAAAQ
jgi:hypothetical protein